MMYGLLGRDSLFNMIVFLILKTLFTDRVLLKFNLNNLLSVY